MPRDSRPAIIDLSLPAEVRTTPDVEHIVIGTITGSLAVTENLLDEGVVEEIFNKIAAFLIIRIGCKECGNFYAVVS